MISDKYGSWTDNTINEIWWSTRRKKKFRNTIDELQWTLQKIPSSLIMWKLLQRGKSKFLCFILINYISSYRIGMNQRFLSDIQFCYRWFHNIDSMRLYNKKEPLMSIFGNAEGLTLVSNFIAYSALSEVFNWKASPQVLATYGFHKISAIPVTLKCEICVVDKWNHLSIQFRVVCFSFHQDF